MRVREKEERERGREGIRRRSGGVKEENMEGKRKRGGRRETGKISGLTGEIHLPEIVAKCGPNSFKTKSQSMTKTANKLSQPFPHVLSRHI